MESELEWIHDCVLLDMRYDASEPSKRLVTLTIGCPRDLGYAPWEGQTLVITAVDVAVLRYLAWGFCRGEETVDAFRTQISPALREEVEVARKAGVLFPDRELSICFRSGSVLELVCQEVRAELADTGAKHDAGT